MYKREISWVLATAMLCTVLCSCKKTNDLTETTVQTEADITEASTQGGTTPDSHFEIEQTEKYDSSEETVDILSDEKESETESSGKKPTTTTAPTTIPHETESSQTKLPNDSEIADEESPIDPDQGEII